MEVNRTKWAYVDGTITVISVGDGGRPTRFVDPPANPIAVGRSVSATRQEIHISWDTSPNRFVRSYNLYWSFNTGQTELFGTSRTPAYVIEDAKEGFYSFALTAVSIDGVESPPVYFEHRVLGISGTSRAVAPPSFIQLTNGSSATEFRGREPSISWGNSGDPFFLNFNVRVLHPSTSVTLREFNTRGNTYTYPYLDNQTDFGGTASRSMIFEVRALDSTGMYSMPVRLTASNPSPGLVSPSIVSNTNGITISFSAPADADVLGSVIWCSTTNGFNPLTTTPDYEGPNTSVFLDKAAGTYYIRVGCYDAFGRTGMNITSQVTIGVSDEVDLTPPATPTGLTLTPSTVVKADGTLDSVITLTWTANNEPDLAGYLIQIKEGASGNFIEFDTSLTRYEFHNLTPAVSYTAKIAAFDKVNNKSSFTTTVSATAGLNTTPPGSATAFSATSSLQTNFLTWTNPTNSDLAYVEVWMATTNNRASAAIVAKVNGTSFTHSGLTTNQSYFYWLRPVNTSGTVAAAYTPTSATGGLSATPGTLSGVEFNTSLRPVESVSALPTTGNFDGRIAYLTTDKKIYRYNGTTWVSTVPTTDLTGFVANTQINDRTISGTKLVTGAITSAEMLAGAVTASKIAASTIHSLLPNPTFEDGVMYPWTTAFGTNYVEAATDNASGLYRMVLQRTYDIGGGQLAAYVYANAFSVTAGDVLQAEFRIKGTSNSSGGAYLRLTWLDSAKSNVGYSDAVSSGAFTTTWTVYGGQVTVPANARYASVEIYHYVQSSSTYMLVDQVVVRPTFGANAIGNSAISTAKIQDSAITAAQIASAAISTAKIQDSAITPAQIAAGAITSVKLVDSAVTNAKLADSTVSTAKIIDAAITNAKIADNTINTKKLIIADFENLVENPHFGDGDVGWVRGTGVTIVNDSANAFTGNWLLKIGIGATGIAVRNELIFPVVSGQEFYVEARAKCVGADVGINLRIRFLAADKSSFVAASGVAFYTTDTSYILRSATITTPAGAIYAWVDFNPIGTITTGRWDVGYVRCQRRNASELIVDGAITASKIQAASITGDRLVANTITAGQIATNAVTADKIAANSVSADKIAANTITAGQLAANAVTADKIAANSITATKLVLVDNTILGPDPGFYDLAWWSLSGISGYNAYSGSTSPQPQRFLGVTRLGDSDYISNTFQIEQGAYYRLKLRIWISTDAAGWIGLAVHIPWTAWAIPYPYSFLASVDSSGYPLINLSTTTITKGQWVEFESIYQASAAQATYLQFRTRHNLSAGSFQFKWEVTRAVSAGLVVDGSIITSKLSANAVTADKIAANTITGDRIAANTINADRIIANTITATQIAAATITGDRLVANTITAGQIAANTITATQIAANTITASQIAANTITATQIAADTITAGQIAAGAITASELAAGSVLASKIGVGISQNMALNSDTAAGLIHYELGWRSWAGSPTPQYTVSSDPWQPLGMKAIALYVPGTPNGIQDIYHKPKTVGNSYQLFPVVAGQRYEFSYYVSVHRCDAYAGLLFFGDDGSTQLLYVGGNAVPSNGVSGRLASWTRASVFATAPSNAAYVMPIIRASFSGTQSDPYIFFTAVHFGDATPNQTELTPWSPAGGTIIDGTRIVTGTLNADKIIAGTITGDRFNTGTSLPGTITVGSTGVSIDTVQSRSSDPAARINAVGTTIDPGRILISGGTTLASWRNGSDATKIEGGAIYANTITANKLRIGSRAISTVAVEFETEKSTNGSGRVKWTSGYVLYEADDGTQTATLISAGYADYANFNSWTYIYWTKGGSSLAATTDWATAQSANNVILASYTAYAGLAVNYGGVIIDGTRITAGTITADRIAANSITAGQIAAETITGTQLAPLTIKASNLLVTGENKVLDPFFDSDEWVIDSGLYFENNSQWGSIGTRRYAVWWSGAGGGPGGARKHLYSRNYIRVSPDQKYRIRAKMYNGGSCGFYLGINFYNSAGGYLGGNFNSVSPGFSGYFSFGNIVPPANTAYGLIYIFNDTNMSGIMLASDISFGQMVGTAFIEDAAISNAKIGNLEVDNIKLANGSVTTVVAAGTASSLDAVATVTITVRANAKILLIATAGGIFAGSTNGAGSVTTKFLDILDSSLTTLYSRVSQYALLNSVGNTGGDTGVDIYYYYHAPVSTQYIYVASTSGTLTFKARGQGVTVLTAVELAK